jgi:hypothetical protein
MKLIRNNPNTFFSPYAGALGTLEVPNAPVIFGMDPLRLLFGQRICKVGLIWLVAA